MTATILAPIRAFQAFIAKKNPHSWQGGGSHSPIPTVVSNDGFKLIEQSRGQDAATEEAGESPHYKHCAARSPP